MKKQFLITTLILMVALAGFWGGFFSHAKTVVKNVEDSESTEVGSDKEGTGLSPKIKDENSGELNQEVVVDHLKLLVYKDWDVTKGMDSVSFSRDGKPLGLLEGLGYSESVESLLPNGVMVRKKDALPDLPFKAYKVETGNDEEKTEIHILIFVEPKKEVYDLHFDSSEIKEADILKVAQTIVVY